MKKAVFAIAIVTAVAVCLLHSCRKEYSLEGLNAFNQPPVAVAEQDPLIILPTGSVLLKGSSSYDPDGVIKAWKWVKVSGPASFSIIQIDSAETMVKQLVEGVYRFELKVTDDKGAAAVDTVQVSINAGGMVSHSPVSCAGPDQTIQLPVTSVSLNGTCSTDPDNNIAGYTWTKISGPASASIANPGGLQTQVNNLSEGTYQFQLKVTDSTGLFALDTVQVMVNAEINNAPGDIYVTGDLDGVATYWRNGQPVKLHSISSSASSIAVAGNDVYVAGSEGDGFIYFTAKYWKNGQELLLADPTGAAANSIAVAGNDVYIAGWKEKGTHFIAQYWKNGQAIPLTNGFTDAEATAIVVSGNDVYVAGYENGIAKYWKNNQAISLTNGSHQAYANSIAVVGIDVYVAGSELNGTAHVAKYWKNGQPVSLTNGTAVQASATSIAVSGNDVYVAGWEGDIFGRVGATGSVAKYWKNGQEISLTKGTFAYTTAIALFNSDVYVAGTEFESSGPVVRYWKNGPAGAVTLATGSRATSILVVPR